MAQFIRLSPQDSSAWSTEETMEPELKEWANFHIADLYDRDPDSHVLAWLISQKLRHGEDKEGITKSSEFIEACQEAGIATNFDLVKHSHSPKYLTHFDVRYWIDGQIKEFTKVNPDSVVLKWLIEKRSEIAQ